MPLPARRTRPASPPPTTMRRRTRASWLRSFFTTDAADDPSSIAVNASLTDGTFTLKQASAAPVSTALTATRSFSSQRPQHHQQHLCRSWHGYPFGLPAGRQYGQHAKHIRHAAAIILPDRPFERDGRERGYRAREPDNFAKQLRGIRACDQHHQRDAGLILKTSSSQDAPCHQAP